MSYILEALKKSERERRQGRAPDLHALSLSPTFEPPSRRTPRWIYVAGGVLITTAVTLTAWFRPWERPPGATATRPPIATDESPPAAPRQAATTSPTAPVAAPVPPQRVTSAARPSQIPLPTPPDGTADAPSRADLAVKATSTDTAAPSPDKPQAAPPPTPNQPAVRATATPEQPVSVQQALNNLTISGFAYTDEPEARTAIINGRLIREGEEAAPSVRLVRVESGGLVLEVMGRQVRVSP